MPEATPDEVAAMRRALELARRGPLVGGNPQVGCVLLRGGHTIAEGWHEGAGTPHAEAAALAAAAAAGEATGGATAVVSLEPCDHTGRTGPCTELLVAAGITRVVFAVPDPNPVAAGGAERLRQAGVAVVGGVLADEGAELLRVWLRSARSGRPFVTVKIAASLDGRVAAADGSSRWITSEAARARGHRLREQVDAIAVGTGTVLVDDPELTARRDGVLAPHQPLRVVVGNRDVPANARVRAPGGELLQLRTHEIGEVLEVLAGRQVRHLLVEGGPTLTAAFLRARAVDELQAHLAPVLLGAGPAAVGDLGIGTIKDALRLRTRRVEQLGDDVLLLADVEAQ